MSHPVALTGIHHITLTVSNVAASADFYIRHFGFRSLLDLGARHILSNGAVVLSVTLPSDKAAPVPTNDRFSENRVGLDHVSFSVAGLRSDRGGPASAPEPPRSFSFHIFRYTTPPAVTFILKSSLIQIGTSLRSTPFISL